MITWSVIENEHAHGTTYCASLHEAFCATFVRGRVEDIESWWKWKSCAENTLYRIALKITGYKTPINELRQVQSVLAEGGGVLAYAGNAIFAISGISHLFTRRFHREDDFVIQYEVVINNGHYHIFRSQIASELEVWKTMAKGIEGIEGW